MAVRKSRVAASIGPVRALALKHVPALILLQRHIDCEWGAELECASEQVVAGFYYPEEVDQIENKKETQDESETRTYDSGSSVFHPTSIESRRRGSEEDEGREVSGTSDGGHLSPV